MESVFPSPATAVMVTVESVYVGWSEVEVAGDDVSFLGLKHKLKTLVFAIEERNILLVGRTVLYLDVVTYITLDYCLLDSTTLGVEG